MTDLQRFHCRIVLQNLCKETHAHTHTFIHMNSYTLYLLCTSDRKTQGPREMGAWDLGKTSCRHSTPAPFARTTRTHASQTRTHGFCISWDSWLSLRLLQPIPPAVTFSNAVSELIARSSNVPFTTFLYKETFELWALSCERAFENVTASGIGRTS